MARSHVEIPKVVDPPSGSPIYRVARADMLLSYSEISAADAVLPDAGNRFDVPDGGVLYFATDRRGCFAETLARFRPTATMRALLANENEGFVACGGVPRDWRNRRLMIGVTLPDALPFVDVESEETHEYLTAAMASTLSGLNVAQLDIATVRGPNRLITRAIAAFLYDAMDDSEEPLYGGIRYVSRIANYECWAVFAGGTMVEETRETIEQHNPELQEIANKFGLRIF